MQVKTTYKEIWSIAWPIILSSLANTVINFTDVAFVSRVGEKELAASALGGVFYFLLVMIGIAIGVGATILIARKAGENKESEIGTIYDNSLVILIAVSFLMLTIVYFFMPTLMNYVIHDTEVAKLCVSYLNVRALGLVFMMVLISLRAFYTGIAVTRIVTYTTVVMMLLNIILCYTFSLGNFGFAALGIVGVALASAISEFVASLYAVVYTFVKKEFRKFHLFKFKEIGKSTSMNILNLSAPIVLQHLISMGAWFVFFLMIEKMGSHELAVSNVVRGIYMVLMTPIWGFSQAANSMVSNVIGQGKKEEVLSLVGKIVRMSFVIGTISTLLVVLFPDFIFQLSTSDKAIIESAKGSFYVISFANIIFSMSMVLLSSVSGTGNTKAAMVIEIINIVVYLLYVFIFTIVLPSRVEIVWGCEILYWAMMALFSFLYLKSGKWKNYKLSNYEID